MQDTPKVVLDIIKRSAAEEWPSDFEMQKFKIGNQVKAYNELETIKRSVKDKSGIFNGILASAEEEYPDDFEMQLYKVKNQLNAIRSIGKYKKTYSTELPPEVLKQIFRKATQEWPNDFEMQEYTIKNQIEAWKDLQDD